MTARVAVYARGRIDAAPRRRVLRLARAGHFRTGGVGCYLDTAACPLGPVVG